MLRRAHWTDTVDDVLHGAVSASRDRQLPVIVSGSWVTTMSSAVEEKPRDAPCLKCRSLRVKSHKKFAHLSLYKSTRCSYSLLIKLFHFYYVTQLCESGFGSRNFVRSSVRLSHACFVAKQCTVNIFIPHERDITLVFWHQQRLKFALKLTHPFRKTPTSTDFRL